MKKKFAFTLAEVLITLSILGVVAAITVPSLMNRNEEKSTVARVIKGYSTFDNTYEKVVVESGVQINNWTSTEWGKFILNLNTTKTCSVSRDGCFVTHEFTGINGVKDWITYADMGPAAILKDGSSFTVWNLRNDCTDVAGSGPCSIIFYDVNGPQKGPGIEGKDIFLYSIFPSGIKNYDTWCTKDKTIYSNYTSGRGCTQYVMHFKNLDYLHDTSKGLKNGKFM